MAAFIFRFYYVLPDDSAELFIDMLINIKIDYLLRYVLNYYCYFFVILSLPTTHYKINDTKQANGMYFS